MEMASRSKAQTGALLVLAFALPLAVAEPFAFEVRHRHLWHGTEGLLRVAADGISFEEGGKHQTHSRKWRFEDIEQLTLSPNMLRVLTYENSPWKIRGDREFVFDGLPEDLAQKLYPEFNRQLDQRFVAALAHDPVNVEWQAPVKLLHRTAGSQGTILVGTDRVVYRTDAPEQARTWRITDIDMVSSSGPFDLAIITFERSGSTYAGHKDFHFELKRRLADAEYNWLWRQVNQAKGLQILNSSNQTGEKQ
jgi:hypothetical protein